MKPGDIVFFDGKTWRVVKIQNGEVTLERHHGGATETTVAPETEVKGFI